MLSVIVVIHYREYDGDVSLCVLHRAVHCFALTTMDETAFASQVVQP